MLTMKERSARWGCFVGHGTPPLGPGLQETWQTLGLLAGEGLTYVADWVNDDQPYFLEAGGRRLVSVPCSQEINDKRFEDRE